MTKQKLNFLQNTILNSWERLDYKVPEKILRGFRELENLSASKIINEKTRTMRTNKLKWAREARQAALFLYGIEHALNVKIEFALSESSDHDVVARWPNEDTLCYTPIQLKELVPSKINPNTTLQVEIGKLEKYVDSENLVVAVYLNRRDRLDFQKVIIPRLKLSMLWVYGSKTLDQSEWFLYGNLLNSPQMYEFKYPLATKNN